MKNIYRAIGLTAIVLMSSLTGSLQAQPDLNNAPKAENPDANQPRNNGRPTPEQIKQWRERFMRQGLERLGFTDTTLQDDVLAHIDAREKLEETMTDYERKVAAGLMNLDDAELSLLLTEYKAAMAGYHAKRLALDEAFEEKIKYSEKPKLELALRLFGGLGENSSQSLRMMRGMGRQGGQGN